VTDESAPKAARCEHDPSFVQRANWMECPPLESEADVRCRTCGGTLSAVLSDEGIRPFAFRPSDRERLGHLLGATADSLAPKLELQMRGYQLQLSGIAGRSFLRTMEAVSRHKGTLEQRRRSIRTHRRRLARALCELEAALDAGDGWTLFNEGRGFPAFEPEEDDDWREWITDLKAMREVAVAEAKSRRQPGPPNKGFEAVLEHRIATLLWNASVGRSTIKAQQVFGLVVYAGTGTRYRDLKRALARSHTSPYKARPMSAEQAARLRRAEERAKLRGFS
jgi:hypothetical protein